MKTLLSLLLIIVVSLSNAQTLEVTHVSVDGGKTAIEVDGYMNINENYIDGFINNQKIVINLDKKVKSKKGNSKGIKYKSSLFEGNYTTKENTYNAMIIVSKFEDGDILIFIKDELGILVIGCKKPKINYKNI